MVMYNFLYVLQRIHSFRIPLGSKGQKIMGLIYFSIPCILGYYIMQYSNSVAEENLRQFRLETQILPETKMQNDVLKNMLQNIEAKK